MGPGWEQRIARLDRRYIYLGLLLFTLGPLVARIALPLYVTPPVLSFYNSIQELPDEEVVFVASDWDAGTYAENEPQTVAVFRQLLRRRLRFVIFSISSANAPQLAHNALQEAIREEFGPVGGPGGYPIYGVHYINAGFKVSNAPWIRSLVQDPAEALLTDWKAVPVTEFPLFADLDSMPEDVSMLIDITASDTIAEWIALVGSEGVLINLACTAVIAPEQYPFLATGQLTGMLTGMRGAAEYELLLGFRGRALLMMAGQSFAHLYIFLLILLGNAAIIRGWIARARRG